MATQYTSILKLALPVQGELSGTWGDVVNDNITSMVEEAIAGRAVINTWTANSHTLTTADGTTSESRAAILTLTDTGTALTGAGTVICPAASKIYIVENGTGQTITVKTSSGTGVAVPNTKNMVVFCDGTNVEEGITNINSLTLNGDGATVSSIKDEDNMASDSATALATQQSIKAYVDSQVGSFDTLAEVLAQGNTTGGTDIAVGTGDDITFADSSKAIFGAGSDLSVYSDGTNGVIESTGNLTLDITSELIIDADSSSIVRFKDAGTEVGLIYGTSSDFYIKSQVANKDLIFQGNDDGSTITALTLDMSAAGAATFNSTIALGDNKQIFFGAGSDGRISFDGTDTLNITASNGTATTLNLTANNFTIGGASALISGTANDSVVINEASGDVDFRVESNGNANMLFVDAGNDHVNIGTSTDYGGSLNVNKKLVVKALDGESANDYVASFQNQEATNSQSFGLSIAAGSTSSDIALNVVDHDASNVLLRVLGDGATTIGGAATFSSSITTTDLEIEAATPVLEIDSTTSANLATLQFTTAGTVDSKITHQASSGDMVIESGRNSTWGGKIYLKTDTFQNAVFTRTTSTFNENSADMDFRVESDNQANMLIVDASADKVGIGGSAGDTTLTVRGSNNSAGDLYTVVGAGNTPGIVVQNAGTTDNNNAAVFFKNDAAVVASVGARFVSHSTEETELRFSTTNSSGTTRERVTISGEGNVGIGTTDGDVTSDGNASRTYVGIIGSGNRGRLNIGSTASNGADGGAISFVNGANELGALYNDANSGSQTVGTMYLTSTGALDVRAAGGAVFNESSADVDFRVESNGNTHMLFVDAGNDAVGIGTSSAGSFTIGDLVVGDGVGARGITIFAATDNESILRFADGTSGDQQYRGQIKYNHAEDSLNFHANGASGSAENLILKTSEAVFNEGGIDTDFRVESNNKSHAIFLDAGNNKIAFNNTTNAVGASDTSLLFRMPQAAGKAVFVHDSGDGGVVIAGSGSASQAALMFGNNWTTDSGTGYTEEYRIVMNGANDSLEFNYNANATTALTLESTGTVVVNDDSADSDFRVESDSQTNMLFVDAGANKIGINQSNPAAMLDIVTVSTAGSDAIRLRQPSSSETYQIQMGQSGVTNDGLVFRSTASTGLLQQWNSSEVVINDDSVDRDFRVESNGNANMLFVDGANNLVGIGRSAPTSIFEVHIDTNKNIGYSGAQGELSSIPALVAYQDNGSLTDIGFRGTTVRFASTSQERMRIDETGVVANEGSHDADFRVESDSNSNMLFVDAGNNRVGIAHGSPNETLSVRNDSAADILSINGASASADTNFANILFRNLHSAASGAIAKVGVDTGSSTDRGDLVISTSASSNTPTERIRVTQEGYSIIPGGVTLGTSVGTYLAAKTLDDYEEGTWTPQLTDASANDCSYTGRTGHYTKIGNMVYVMFALTVSSKTGVGNGLQIRGLPFTVANVSHGGAEPSSGAISFANNLVSTDLGAGIIVRANNATSYAELKYTPDGAQTSIGGTNWHGADITDNTFMSGSFWYMV